MAGGFNQHLFSGQARPDVVQVLHVRRNGVAQPFVARYVLATKGGTVPVAPVMDWFVPIVHMEARKAYELVFDGRHMRRETTSAGSFAIRDRRIVQYNNAQSVNNVSFYIPKAALDELAGQLGFPVIQELPSLLERDCHDPVMFHVAKTMEFALERPAEVSPLFLDHVFQAVCVHLAQAYGGAGAGRLAPRGGLSPRKLERVKEALLGDPGAGLEGLAALCGMSARHFTRAFRQATGSSPHQWLLMQRVERAKALLRASQAPISDIALQCGFAGQSHLTRVFSKSVGVSPAAWRRSRTG